MNNTELLAQNLKYLRHQIGVSQAEICRQLAFSPTKYNNYESGVSKPGLDDFVKLFNYFGVSASDLLQSNLEDGKLILGEPDAEYGQSGKLTGKKNSKLKAVFMSKKQKFALLGTEQAWQSVIDDYNHTISHLKALIADFEQKINNIKAIQSDENRSKKAL